MFNSLFVFSTVFLAASVSGALAGGEDNPCDCPVPCNYTVYSTSLSTAAIPSESVARDLLSMAQQVPGSGATGASSGAASSSSSSSGSFSSFSSTSEQDQSDLFTEGYLE